MRQSALLATTVARQPAMRRSLKLQASHKEKPWGRNVYPHFLGNAAGRKVGEIWFEHPDATDLPLLAKFIFTSANLSVQVHPDDRDARARGLKRGKSECWYIIDAEPGACIGIGLNKAMTPEALRSAALDGSIARHINWRPVNKHDFFFVPAGTVHAIGAGITLLEFQQNADVTYRLYDFDRPRELHIDEGIAVAHPDQSRGAHAILSSDCDSTLLNNGLFSLVRASSPEAIPASMIGRQKWVIPIEGFAYADGERCAVGECMLVEPFTPIDFSDEATVLVGVAGSVADES